MLLLLLFGNMKVKAQSSQTNPLSIPATPTPAASMQQAPGRSHAVWVWTLPDTESGNIRMWFTAHDKGLELTGASPMSKRVVLSDENTCSDLCP